MRFRLTLPSCRRRSVSADKRRFGHDPTLDLVLKTWRSLWLWFPAMAPITLTAGFGGVLGGRIGRRPQAAEKEAEARL